MSDSDGRCIAGRLVRLRFRNRKTKAVRESTVVYPWRWTKGNVLASARSAHPEMTVAISEWHPYSKDKSFEPTVWIVSPTKILNYTTTGGRDSAVADATDKGGYR